MVNVTFYYLHDQLESKQVKSMLDQVKKRRDFNLILIDVGEDRALSDHYRGRVPQIVIGPYTIREQFSEQNIEVAIGAASDRQRKLDEGDDQNYQVRVERGKVFSWGDKVAYWLSKHYLFLFNLVLGLYVGFSFGAPILMKIGFETGAKAIYTIYSPLCHQLAFRSWFLFGDQAFYPRELAGTGLGITYEAIAGIPTGGNEKTDAFVLDARAFLGNSQAGYKLALCERDVAMYGSILLFGIFFALSGRKVNQIPWYIWFIFGLLPIAVDGLSQLPSLFPGLPDFLPNRESTPFLRTLTGGLFGMFTAWYLYPLLEESMRQTYSILTSKKAAIAQLSHQDPE